MIACWLSFVCLLIVGCFPVFACYASVVWFTNAGCLSFVCLLIVGCFLVVGTLFRGSLVLARLLFRA